MTAEVVTELGVTKRTIPEGTSCYWLTEAGKFAHLDSFSKGEGFQVVVDDVSEIAPEIELTLAVTPANKREFILPNRERVIPR
ncbi:hypothetical protein KKB64_01290 [Patescibacteria group bacterium]|nr:hypothetical protein [Patescibacteria group bacterium]MBU1472409.1 hypothetical protein [Patescibacteria group bacterium]MBU2460057.1 hypothetical protein [Patescibacteria group bacterium]